MNDYYYDVLSMVPNGLLVTAASRLPEPSTMTEHFERVILKLPNGRRVEVTFARIAETQDGVKKWSWTPAGAVLIDRR
jgi:hypothetical protein